MLRLRQGLKGAIYILLSILFLIVLKLLFRLRVRGKPNVHRDGEYIVVARHRSYWDIPLMVVAVGWRNRIQFIARKGIMRYNVLVKPVIRAYSTIIDRESFSKADFRRMLEAIKRERLIGIFPEGTTRRRVDAKAGAVRFAAMAGKELLPINIRTRGPYPPAYPFRFPSVTVSIGHPVSVAVLEREVEDEGPRSERHRRMSERLMQRVDTA